MKDTAAMPKIPRPTTTATTIRMTFRALPLFGAAGSGVAAAAGEEGVADDTRPTGWVAPHLVQNFAPPSRVAPQELQNAIRFASTYFCTNAGVYRKFTARYFAFLCVLFRPSRSKALTAKLARHIQFLKQPGR